VNAEVVGKVSEGGDNIVSRIVAGEIDLVMNTPRGSSGPRLDGYEIRTAAVRRGIPCVTTIQGLAAAVQGIEAITRGEVGVRSLQEHAKALRGQGPGLRDEVARPEGQWGVPGDGVRGLAPGEAECPPGPAGTPDDG